MTTTAIHRMTAQAKMMRERGYILAAEAAELLGHNISTVHRWMDDGKVAGEIVGGTRRYVKLASLKEHVGPEMATKLDAPPSPEVPDAEG